MGRDPFEARGFAWPFGIGFVFQTLDDGQGVLIARLVHKFGEIQTLKGAKPDAVEFVPMEIPDRFFPPGYQPGDTWDAAFYGGPTRRPLLPLNADGRAEIDRLLGRLGLPPVA